LSAQVWWYAARGSGLVAWALLSGSVIWGLLVSLRLRRGLVNRAWLLDLHRFLGGTALAFTGVHLAALLLDDYVGFGVLDLLVPFASAWRPLAVALGVLGLYLLLAVELTSLARARLPARLWRRVHLLALPLFALATLHGLLAGADAGHPLMTGAVLAVLVLVGALAVARVALPRPRGRRGRAPQASAAAKGMRPANSGWSM
jgi:sulfoxide reductase heme-binding subunit YedZ